MKKLVGALVLATLGSAIAAAQCTVSQAYGLQCADAPAAATCTPTTPPGTLCVWPGGVPVQFNSVGQGKAPVQGVIVIDKQGQQDVRVAWNIFLYLDPVCEPFNEPAVSPYWAYGGEEGPCALGQ